MTALKWISIGVYILSNRVLQILNRLIIKQLTKRNELKTNRFLSTHVNF